MEIVIVNISSGLVHDWLLHLLSIEGTKPMIEKMSQNYIPIKIHLNMYNNYYLEHIFQVA